MNGKRKWILGILLGAVVTVCSALPALAYHRSTGAAISAGFTDLPLREWPGVYSGIVMQMQRGQPMDVMWDGGDGWAYVNAGGKRGWVCLENTY